MSRRQSPRETRKRMRQGTLNSLAGIPEGSDAKRSRRDAVSDMCGTWNEEVKGLMLFQPSSWKSPNTILGKQTTLIRIAAFDLDTTLITTKTRAKFPKSANDWRLLNNQVTRSFSELSAQGYVLVIFTNQAGVSNGRITESFIRIRLEGILSALKEDIGVLVATGKDNFRKPGTGMWDYLMQLAGGADRVDKKNSFYVGDAAGRPTRPAHPADFSDSDLKFSINIGVPFRTPEEHFLDKMSEAVSVDNIKGFDPRVMISSPDIGSTFIDDNTDLDLLLRSIVSPSQLVDELHMGSSSGDEVPAIQIMVLMHGFPASGKTTFVKRHLLPRGFVWVNQDTVHTFSRCSRATKEGLASGKSIVVDNTNPDRNARAKYIDIGKAHDRNIKIICLVMETPKEVAQHLNVVRERESIGSRPKVPVVAYHAFSKCRQLPRETERIDRIGVVRFVPSFASEQERYFFTRLS